MIQINARVLNRRIEHGKIGADVAARIGLATDARLVGGLFEATTGLPLIRGQ